MKRWIQGETVVIRNIARSDGGVSAATAAIAISDDDEALTLYIPIGTVAKDNYDVAEAERASAVGTLPPARERPFAERMWQVPTIRLYLPRTAFSVWLFFGKDGTFASWYGNLEAPYARTPIGIDTQDHALDIVADAQGSWSWKDEAEFARRLELRLDSAEHQAAVREAGRDFIARLQARARPFDGRWQSWRPPDDWQARALPPDWAADFGTHRGAPS